jgi:hypothetical protein
MLGSFGREVAVSIDGRRVGAVSDELAMPAGWIELGRTSLEAGRARVSVVRGGGDLKPGNGDGRRMIGPVAISPAELRPAPMSVAPERWRELCGERLAWVDLVTGG